MFYSKKIILFANLNIQCKNNQTQTQAVATWKPPRQPWQTIYYIMDVNKMYFPHIKCLITSPTRKSVYPQIYHTKQYKKPPLSELISHFLQTPRIFRCLRAKKNVGRRNCNFLNTSTKISENKKRCGILSGVFTDLSI